MQVHHPVRPFQGIGLRFPFYLLWYIPRICPLIWTGNMCRSKIQHQKKFTLAKKMDTYEVRFGITFSGCTNINEPEDDPKYWCATATDGENNFISSDALGATSDWGYCSTSCPIQDLGALIEQFDPRESSE